SLLYTLSLHDALPISSSVRVVEQAAVPRVDEHALALVHERPGLGDRNPPDGPKLRASRIRIGHPHTVTPSLLGRQEDPFGCDSRSEEHTSELQSRGHL